MGLAEPLLMGSACCRACGRLQVWLCSRAVALFREDVFASCTLCFPQDPVSDIFIPGHLVVTDIISSVKKGRKLQADHPTLTVLL